MVVCAADFFEAGSHLVSTTTWRSLKNITSTMSFGPIAVTNCSATCFASLKELPIRRSASTRIRHAVPTPGWLVAWPKVVALTNFAGRSVSSTVTVKTALAAGKGKGSYSAPGFSSDSAMQESWLLPVSAAQGAVASLTRLACTTSTTIEMSGSPLLWLARGSMRRRCASGAADENEAKNSHPATARSAWTSLGHRCSKRMSVVPVLLDDLDDR